MHNNTSNTRGIGERGKRKQVFAHTKSKIGKGIALLQETNSCANKAHEWVNDWDGPLFLNHGTSASRGTAILITKDLEHKDNMSKILMVDCSSSLLKWKSNFF